MVRNGQVVAVKPRPAFAAYFQAVAHTVSHHQNRRLLRLACAAGGTMR
jgi:hypothetical protein